MGVREGAFLKASIIACLLLFSLPSATVCRQKETADQFIERVRKAITNDEWGRAQSGIRHALALDPESQKALLLAAQVYLHEGARSMAIESLEKAIKSQPDNPEAHFMLAQCLLDAGKADRSREEVSIAITQGAALFPAYHLLAKLDLAKGDFSAAIASLETAIQLSPNDETGESAKLRQQIEEAREFVEKLKQFATLEAGQKAQGIVRPRLLNSPSPRYTEEARRLKIQGAVWLGVLVAETGDVESVLILRGLGQGLDESAVDAARKIKFSPATRDGNPIPYWMNVMIEFNIR